MLAIFRVLAITIAANVVLAASGQTPQDVILWMEKQNNKVTYRSDTRIIDESKLLDFFAEINDRSRTRPTIFVLFQDNIGLSEIEGIGMDILKVASFKIGYFCYSKEFAKAQEIFFADELVPLSAFKR